MQQQIAPFFPPVVTVLGHVDHGKTTLLDALRKTAIVDREYGGITQSIGTSSIETMYEGIKRKITFIDTPGHEAFMKMRSRGAQAATIGLLIVSAVDGVMPQTRESIKLLQQAHIPFILVLTKSDLPGKNPEKVKQQVIRENVLLEGYSGDVPVIEISAKTGQNLKELLDLILLVQTFHPHQADAAAAVQAIVIESKLDSRTGSRATVIVKNGMLKLRETYSCDGQTFKLRSIMDDTKKQLQEATVGDGVEILGMEKVLGVGSIVTTEVQAQKPVEQKSGMPEVAYMPHKQDTKLSLILVADTQGSLEAIEHALPEDVSLLQSKTGEITEADVLLAKSTQSIILSFNSKVRPDVEKLAYTEKILVKNYKIIYEMLDEINDVIAGRAQARMEVILGEAKVLAKFPFEKTFAYGINITTGRVARGDKVRIMRGDLAVGETTMLSLRIGKNVVSKVEKGHEAGIVLSKPLDITIGDMVLFLN